MEDGKFKGQRTYKSKKRILISVMKFDLGPNENLQNGKRKDYSEFIEHISFNMI